MFGCSQERERRDHTTNIVTKRTMGEGFHHLDPVHVHGIICKLCAYRFQHTICI